MMGTQANAREAERVSNTKRSKTSRQNKYNPTKPSSKLKVIHDGRFGTYRKPK